MKKIAMIPTAFVWNNFGPYHADRLERLGSWFAGEKLIVGIEIAGSVGMYSWASPPSATGTKHVTLFPNRVFERVPRVRIFSSLLSTLLRVGARDVFLCHYERVEIFAVAMCLRALGRRVYLMIDSKFDDKIRTLRRELIKSVFFLPYNGGLVSGRRSANYLKFFGFKASRIFAGYDTVSIERLRQLATTAMAAGPITFQTRHFVIVARLVPNKNVGMAIRAYARYCSQAGEVTRELHIYGVGPLEDDLRKLANELNLAGVKFFGFVQNPSLAPALSAALALILPSSAEQWGLVINEALALGIPILCSDNVGARDTLVRVGVNGYVFEPDNEQGLGHLMLRLSTDRLEWQRLSAGATVIAPQGDVDSFCKGVEGLLHLHGKGRAKGIFTKNPGNYET
jgi:glycosyltransferase involved in cell wall biosynthesis